MVIESIITYVAFALGLFLLVKGADWLVDGGSSLARNLRISSLVIGLTIIAFGTSLPELVVSLFSSYNGSGEIILGNIIGSNIANILLILGIASIISTISAKASTVWKQIPFLVLISLIFFVIANDIAIDNAASSMITRSDGIVLLGFFVIFSAYIYELIKSSRSEIKVVVEKRTNFNSWMLVGIGLLSLFLGGKLVVDGVVKIATDLNFSEYAVSAIAVAIGTSLPELITAIVATLKKEMDLVVGNIVGSNIFNSLLVVGMSSTIRPIPVIGHTLDFVFMLVATFLLMIYLVATNHKLERWEGVTLLALYVAYVAMVIIRR